MHTEPVVPAVVTGEDRSSRLINNGFSEQYASEDLEVLYDKRLSSPQVPFLCGCRDQKSHDEASLRAEGFWIPHITPLGALVTAKSHAGLGRAAGGS